MEATVLLMEIKHFPALKVDGIGFFFVGTNTTTRRERPATIRVENGENRDKRFTISND